MELVGEFDQKFRALTPIEVGKIIEDILEGLGYFGHNSSVNDAGRSPARLGDLAHRARRVPVTNSCTPGARHGGDGELNGQGFGRFKGGRRPPYRCRRLYPVSIGH